MRKRDRRRKTIRNLTVTTIILGFIVMITLPSFTRGGTSLPQKIALEVIGAGQAAATSVFSGISDIWQDYIALRGVRKENIALKKDLARCRREIVRLSEAEAQNIRLSRLLALKKQIKTPQITARIIGHDPSDWFRTLTIDRGENAGVRRGMPVITEEGVVGKIFSTSNNRAKIMLGIDPNNAVAGLVQHCRAQGIIRGDGDAFVFNYVMKNLAIRKNDLVVTSGMSGEFPKGIPIGRIISINNTPRGMFQEVRVTPTVDFNRLEYVNILLRKNPLTE